jgi:uncharacterized membrane-anchored protein
MTWVRLVAIAIGLNGWLAIAAVADERPTSRDEAAALVASLKFQQGQIALEGNVATLQVPETMRFLNSADATKVLVNLWGNPPHGSPLGLLVPAECDLLGDCWAVIVTYEEDGYVKDDDAQKIDYSAMLKQMQKDTAAANKQRKREGYEPVELVGWATPPHYDRASHKLYWAKELKFGDQPENTLNYNIRVLGRRGVLVLNAVAGMTQLQEIEQATPAILAAVDFNPGNRYADFSATSGDKIATYGVGALVAGGVAAKAGLFKGLFALLLGAKKFVIIALAAVAVAVRKFFAARSEKSSGG